MIEFESTHLYFRELNQNDVSSKYVSWLNNPKVNRYLEVRHTFHTIESCKIFVCSMNASEENYLFGLFSKQGKEHIGNIKIGFINRHHNRAEVSLFIGDDRLWGKGLATEAILRITSWGFEFLGLAKIEAGCYSENIGSLKAFLKAGYQVEGFLRCHSLIEDRRIGSFCLGILPHESHKKN